MRNLRTVLAAALASAALAAPAWSDACDPLVPGAPPIFSVATRHSDKSDNMGIKIENRFPGVYAMVVQIVGKEEKRDQLLVLAEQSQVGGGKPIQSLREFSPEETLTFSMKDLPVNVSHTIREPADQSAAIVVQILFEDGSRRAYSLCEVGATADLTVTPSDSGPDMPGGCYCVRLQCSGGSSCNIEQECCGGHPAGACACCSCSPSGGCMITCPPCDWIP